MKKFIRKMVRRRSKRRARKSLLLRCTSFFIEAGTLPCFSLFLKIKSFRLTRYLSFPLLF
jgi:hypothetical protein